MPMKTLPAKLQRDRPGRRRPKRGRLTLPAQKRALTFSSRIKGHHSPPSTVDKFPMASANGATGDALQLYLREIGKVPLLTPQEEIELAKRIRRGDEAARDQMIKANLRLVVKIARDYEGMGVPLLDLISEGNLGLIKGVERFDPKKGAKLSTYAAWWIKQNIRLALVNQSKTIRLPVHVVDRLTHLRRAEVKLRETLEREPTDEELAAEVQLDVRRVRLSRQAARAPISLDAPLDEGASTFAEVVADAEAAAPFDALIQQTDARRLREVFGVLTGREKTILSLRFGLEDDRARTLEEIGQKLDLTRERIRQIQEQALGKLRARMSQGDGEVAEADQAMVVTA